jgi:transposase
MPESGGIRLAKLCDTKFGRFVKAKTNQHELGTKQAVVIALSGGNQADISLAEELTDCLPEDSTLIADKAYDSSSLRQTAATKGINTCIPGRSNRTTTVPFSTTLYRRRHRVENFFERIKRYRRVATRYDKLAETFLGFVCLAILFTLRLT